MTDYPIYNTKPKVNSYNIDRYGVGYPYIHNVYDRVYEWDKLTQIKTPKLDKKGDPVFSFTYHYNKHNL